MRTLAILLSLTALIDAATLQVCAACSPHTTIASALAVAQCGDVIQLASGETFAANELQAAALTCASNNRVQIVPSLLARLPMGRIYRGHPALAVLNIGSGYNYAINFGPRTGFASSADTTGNTITLDATGWTADEPIVCGGHQLNVSLPAPLVMGQVYFVRAPSGGTIQLAATAGGAAIDITTIGSAGAVTSYYDRFSCSSMRTTRGFLLRGVDIRQAAVPSSSIQIGTSLAHHLASPSDIVIDQVVTGGSVDYADAPTSGIQIRGRGIRITRSYLGRHCNTGQESKAISLATGKAITIEDNYMEACSIGILIGGTGTRPWQGDPGEAQQPSDIVIRNNTIMKPGSALVFLQTTSPTIGSACYYAGGSGAYWRNTSTNATFTCDAAGTWQTNGSVSNTYGVQVPKNGIEGKAEDGLLIEGNMITGSFAAEHVGQAMCIQVSITADTGGSGSYYGAMQNVSVRNNWCDRTWGGIYTQLGNVGPIQQPNNIDVFNNLLTRLAEPTLTSLLPVLATNYHGYAGRAMPSNGTAHRDNTVRAGASQTNHVGFGIIQQNASLTGATTTFQGLQVLNNIVPGGNYPTVWVWQAGNFKTDCADLAAISDTSLRWLNNVTYSPSGSNTVLPCSPRVANLATTAPVFVGSATSTVVEDHGQASTSPYSARCSSGCLFTATDGGDVGVDIPRLRNALDGNRAFATASSGSVTVRFREYTTTACTVYVHSSRGRTAGSLLASGGGSITTYGARSVALGVTAGPRWWSVDCSGRVYGGEILVP